MKTRYSIIFLLLMGTIAYAQTPEAFKYQAVVKNGSGDVLANTTVALRISVLQSSENGAAVYEEVFHPTTNPHGLVDLEIGDASFHTIDWGGHMYFLKIEVDPENGSSFTHLGTSPLLSVPYAQHARTVELDRVEDADPDPGNELQILSLSGSDLTISEGNTVTLPGTGGGDNWGAQVVESDATLSGTGTGGDPLGVVGDLTDDQTLSIVGSDLTISEGNTITLPGTGGGDNWGAQVVESDATLSGTGTGGDPLGVVGDLTDNQTLSIVGNSLTISDGNTVGLPSSPWSLNGSDIYYSAGNVGINVSTPAEDLHVNGNAMFEWYSGDLRITTPGSWPGFISYIQSGERRDIAFRDLGIAITASTTSSSPGLMDGLWVTPGGNVGICSWSPGNYPLLVNERDQYGLAIRNGATGEYWEIYTGSNDVLALYRGTTILGTFDGTTGVYTPLSDKRVKTHINPLPNSLPKVLSMKPSTYEMKSDKAGTRQIGFVAQDVREQFPELVNKTVDDKTGKSIFTVNYNGIAVVAVKAIQEQQEIIRSQAETIEQLTARMEELERRFESLQQGVRRSR